MNPRSSLPDGGERLGWDESRCGGNEDPTATETLDGNVGTDAASSPASF